MIIDSESGLRLSERYTRVATPDLGEAGAVIEQLQGAFTARPAGATAREQPVHVRAIACGHVAISTFQFGRTLEIFPHGLADAVLVTTAIAGRAGLHAGAGHARHAHGIEPGSTFVAQEEDQPSFLYQPDTEVLKLRFDRQRFETFSRKMGDHAPAGPLRFDYMMPANAASGRWTSLLRFVVATLNGTASSQELASIEELLMLTLLSVQPGTHHADRMPGPARISPRQFRQAVEYMHQNLESDIRLSDLADAACCSIRSLTRAFQQGCDTTPMQYLHGLRLQQVHAELARAAARDTTIAEIAYRWGFRHLGEFNRKYREVYGVTPSATRTGAGG